MSKLPSDITKLIDARQLEIDETFKHNLKHKLFKGNTNMAKAKKQSKLNFNAPSWQSLFKKLNTASGLAVIALLVVVGGASAMISSKQTRSNSERKTEIPANLEGVMSIEDIKAKAIAEVPSVDVTGIELENEDGVLIYKVRYADGSYRFFDAKTGEIINDSVAGLEKDDSVPAGYVPGIDLAMARSIAQDQRPGKTINKIELETENGVVVYSVRFSDDGRVDINANDGSVLRVRSGESASSNSDSDDSNDDQNDDSNSGSGSDDSDDQNDDSGSNSGSDDNSDDSSNDNDQDESDDGDNSGSGSSGSGSSN
jgi:uncharacterized membrane protein YkoI